ncbi:acyl-CoA dehydrogenase [Alicycliphilus denitrificans]|jgi:alkylation response protein AidB-like acyl-CoA dehydrogenase|uniref:3-sulfinopropanoyl-CoA desulfinase n=1 Tax=Alicycliphilus denitrificans TaxID=179636 RepID=A0A858ZRR2_9BURK|nr:acyl-CoA dehydrogenase family protein [Alicycliphilus denitrificans]QKD43555.1 acyl-CoA dehydrogenase [Alicycliphilus denitrificans]
MDFQHSKEQKMLVNLADRLGREQFAAKSARWDAKHEYPHENVKALREAGLLGMTIPRKFGGQERPLIDVVLVIEQIAKYCGVTARIVVETNMGALGSIMAYGTEAQQREVARRVLEDGDKPAIGMTEPSAGTDLASLRTTASKRNGTYILNGVKHWITGGGISKTNLIFARLLDQEGNDQGIGGILVDLGTPGFTVGRVEAAMGLRGIPEAELIFNECVVPAANVVLRDPKDGFKKLMNGYNAQRIGASAVALGIAQGAHDLAIDYMCQREAFGKKLKDFQGLEWIIAQGEMRLEAARLLIYRAACNARKLANNVMLPEMKEASLAKAFVGHEAFHSVSESLQMFGAAGYSADLPLERMLRDVRMFQIGGGTSQAQLNMIARSIFSNR